MVQRPVFDDACFSLQAAVAANSGDPSPSQRVTEELDVNMRYVSYMMHYDAIFGQRKRIC